MRRITIRARVETDMHRGPIEYQADVTLVESEDGTLRIESVSATPEEHERLTDAWMNS